MGVGGGGWEGEGLGARGVYHFTRDRTRLCLSLSCVDPQTHQPRKTKWYR